MSHLICSCDMFLFNDTLFRAVFGQVGYEKPLETLINAVFENAGDKPVVLDRILNPFQLKELAGQKESILDIKARDSLGRYIDIEVQVTDHIHFRERILYYWSRVYGAQFQKGDEYSELKPVIGIVFVRFPIHAGYPQEFWDTIELTYRRHPDISYSDHLTLYYVMIPDDLTGESPTDINEVLARWLMMLNYPQNKEQVEMFASEDPNIAMIMEKTDEVLADPQMQYYLEAKHKAETTRATIYASELKKAYAEGYAEGRIQRIKQYLISRFDWLPDAIERKLDAKVTANTDKAECDRLLDLALDCASLDEFESSL